MYGQSFNAFTEQEAQIQLLARRLWEEEGRPHGRAGDHLLRARELVEAGFMGMAFGAPIPQSLLCLGNRTGGGRTQT
jgi:hypothetical protein